MEKEQMASWAALNMYNTHGPLPMKIAKTLLETNTKAHLVGYCSAPNSWCGPYDYAVIDLCDIQTTVHAYDPDEELRDGHDQWLMEL